MPRLQKAALTKHNRVVLVLYVPIDIGCCRLVGALFFTQAWNQISILLSTFTTTSHSLFNLPPSKDQIRQDQIRYPDQALVARTEPAAIQEQSSIQEQSRGLVLSCPSRNGRVNSNRSHPITSLHGNIQLFLLCHTCHLLPPSTFTLVTAPPHHITQPDPTATASNERTTTTTTTTTIRRNINS